LRRPGGRIPLPAAIVHPHLLRCPDGAHRLTRPTTAAAASAARWIFEGVASEKKDRSPQMPGQLRRTAEITWRTADYFCQVRFL